VTDTTPVSGGICFQNIVFINLVTGDRTDRQTDRQTAKWIKG